MTKQGLLDSYLWRRDMVVAATRASRSLLGGKRRRAACRKGPRKDRRLALSDFKAVKASWGDET